MGGAQVYWRNEHPRFPDGGKLSQFMEALHIGGEMDFKGPLGHFVYLGRGRCWPAVDVPAAPLPEQLACAPCLMFLQRTPVSFLNCNHDFWCKTASIFNGRHFPPCGDAWLWADMGVTGGACRGAGTSSTARAGPWSGCP